MYQDVIITTVDSEFNIGYVVDIITIEHTTNHRVKGEVRVLVRVGLNYYERRIDQVVLVKKDK